MTDASSHLAERLGSELNRLGYYLAVAESCTGGSLAAAITALPGASSFFLGGIVSYSNDVKVALLGVAPEVLESDGAVSEATARSMATGVRERLAADVGVAITGIAGPTGATPTKPVGLVYIAVATPNRTVVRCDVWPGDRAEVRRTSVQTALALTVEALARQSAAGEA